MHLEREHKKWYGKVFKKEILMTKIFLNVAVNIIHGSRIFEAWELKRDLENLQKIKQKRTDKEAIIHKAIQDSD